MSERSLNYDDVLEIIRIVEKADKFTDFRMRFEGMEIELSRGGKTATAPERQAAAASPGLPALVEQKADALQTPAVAAPKAPVPPTEGMVVVRAPMVGTFYHAPEPGAKPFVEVGAAVGEHDTVCIIEVMKLMNALSAETNGVVREILVKDGATVEYGQPLIVIESIR